MDEARITVGILPDKKGEILNDKFCAFDDKVEDRRLLKKETKKTLNYFFQHARVYQTFKYLIHMRQPPTKSTKPE